MGICNKISASTLKKVLVKSGRYSLSLLSFENIRTTLRSGLNSPVWLGQLNNKIVQYFNNNRPLPVINVYNIKEDVPSKCFKEIKLGVNSSSYYASETQINTYKGLKANDYLYLTIMDVNHKSAYFIDEGGFEKRIVIAKKTAFNDIFLITYKDIPKKKGNILFFLEFGIEIPPTLGSTACKSSVTLSKIALFDDLKEKQLLFDGVFTGFARFLGKNFFGWPISWENTSEELFYLFNKNFAKAKIITSKDYSSDLQSAVPKNTWIGIIPKSKR